MVKHLPHFEDLLFIHGSQVYQTIAEEIIRDDVIFSIKWDGAPAVVVGNDDYYGGEFVSTKSFHNKTPKVWTPETIHEIEDLDLQNKLRSVLDASLGHIAPGCIYQGDLLFWERNSISPFSWRVRPNVVMYEVPSHRIRDSRVGAVFHTQLRGKETLKSPHVWDPGHKFYPRIIPLLKPQRHITINPFAADIMQGYMNHCVKNDLSFNLEPAAIRWYLTERMRTHIDSLKTERGKEVAKAKWDTIWDSIIVQNLADANAIMQYILEWKQDLLTALNKSAHGHTEVIPYIGDHETHEGFVVTTQYYGEPLQFKVVDRRIFSAANFEAHK